MVDIPAELFMAVRSSWTDPGDENLRRAIASARDETLHSVLPPVERSDPSTGQWSGEHDRLSRTALIPASKLMTLEKQRRIECILTPHHGSSSGNAIFCDHSRQTKVYVKLRKRSSRTGSKGHRRRWQRRSKKVYLGMVKPLHLIAASKDILAVMEVLLNLPMKFMISLASGFHNAPLIYGDETVRQAPHVKNLRSGLEAGTKEFGYGFFDGFSGLITQPLHGAEEEGARGFLKGIGKGFGGLMLKSVSAVIGLPTYTVRGLCAEARKSQRKHFNCATVAGRVVQGYEEWQISTLEQRRETVSRWHASKPVASRLYQKWT